MPDNEPRSQSGASSACERCGSFDALEIAGHFLCAGCIALAGSACGGSSDDDS
jgi:hypothetical protein